MPSVKLPSLSRRRFIIGTTMAGLGLAAWPARSATLAGGTGLPPVDIGITKDKKVKFPPWSPETEPPSGEPPNPFPSNERVGFAVVALGKLSLEQILPAFAQSKKAKLTALVSGTPDKLKAIAYQYGIGEENCYTYDGFDRIKDNPNVQVVYIVLPNALHHEFVLRSAKAGKNVLCEKPMATSSDEAREMVQACRSAGTKLMIAYRIQYELHARAAMRMIQSGALGTVDAIDTVNVQSLSDPAQWRLNKALSGGGSLPDIGLYCLNTVRALTREEPVEIMGTTVTAPDDPRFKNVEDKVSFMLRFPSGIIANCFSSYSAHERRAYTVLGTTGWLNVDNAYGYDGQKSTLAHRVGPDEVVTEQRIASKNQFALELDHMAQCVRENRIPRTPGEEGLQDQLLMETIYESARSRKPISMASAPKLDVTRGPALDDVPD